MGSRLVAVVVPTSLETSFTPDEEISLRHIDHYLGRYDRYFLCPSGMSPSRPGYALAPFPRRYFGGLREHTRLLLTEELYARFTNYKYILFHHLDSLVLFDRLEQWCETDLDLIGPPWLQCDDSPWVTNPRVGNGGFTLMKIQSHLNVLRSSRPSVDVEEYWQALCAVTPRHRRWLQWPRKLLKRLHLFNNVRWETGRVKYGADYFWSDNAVKFWPDFRVASFTQGLEFAFEVAPRTCFELNQRRLPFGSHAWPRYDRSFWEPYLLR
jgi:hypothetical protein